MSQFFLLFLYAFFGSVVALIGGIVFLYIRPWKSFLTKYSVPFAAGVLLTAGFAGLLPEAVHTLGEQAFTVVLIAFIASYIFEQIVCALHHHDHDDEKHTHCSVDEGSLFLVVVGDSIHNFIDGVAIAASFLVNPGLGFITTVSTFLHEVPHEIGDFGIMLKAGWNNKKILLINFFSSLFTIVGAMAVYFVIHNETVISHLLAVAAGMFLYLGASDFLPHAGEGMSKKKLLASLLLGVAIMLGVFRLVPHSHEDNHQHEDIAHEEHGEMHHDIEP